MQACMLDSQEAQSVAVLLSLSATMAKLPAALSAQHPLSRQHTARHQYVRACTHSQSQRGDIFSNQGTRTRAASSARFLPVATPTPSMAVPELHMTALTSAKSTFTNPGIVMMSEMP